MRTLLLCFILLTITSLSQAQAVANPASDLTACSDTDFSQFDLSVNDAQIIGDQNNVTVSYHTSQTDADNKINPLIFKIFDSLMRVSFGFEIYSKVSSE